MPNAASANPGQGPTIKAGFANGSESLEEEVDLIDLLADVLKAQGLEFRKQGDGLVSAAGLVLRPQFVSLEPKHPKGAKVCSTIEFSHPDFGRVLPFEYQHAQGGDLGAAFRGGFESWAKYDMPAIFDALKPEPDDCPYLTMNYPANAERSAVRRRRVILGPPLHMAQKHDNAIDAEHPFCPCCLLTNSIDAFKSLLDADGVFGLRMFVMRNENGEVEADCRVNGEDFAAGEGALIKYAEGWSDRGYEYRKQYVIVQNLGVAED